MAWAPLGWKPAWYSEIDPHACAVLFIGERIQMFEHMTKG